MSENNNIDTKGNGNLKHLSFEEYFGSDWRKHFEEKDTVQNILAAAGLSNSHEFVQINSRYLVNNNRVAVIALIKRKNTEVLEKLIIDVIAGNSTFEQVYDVVYNTGSDCDYRMMICDWHSKNKVPGLWMTDNIMCQLINLFDCQLFLYWISADALRDVDGTMKVIYTVIESVSKSSNSEKMFDRHDLEYAELCLHTIQASGYFSSQDNHCLQFGNYYEDENSWAEWTDECIIAEADMDQDEYTWLFTNRAENIKDDNCSYMYDKEIRTLTITEAIPFQNFKYSLPNDKFALANHFYHRARIGFWIDDLLGERETEETDENASIEACPSKIIPQEISLCPDQSECAPEPEPIIHPSVLEFLGPNWKEYFLKPETIKNLIEVIETQIRFKDFYRKSQRRREVSGNMNDTKAYDFIEVNSITQLGLDRERIIASFRDKSSGLFEKWSIDITSKYPLLDQMFHALYNSDDGCAKKVIICLKDFYHNNESDADAKVERDAFEDILYSITSFTDNIYTIHATLTDSGDEASSFEILFLQGLSSCERKKVPPRVVFESEIWDSYYGKFIYGFAFEDKGKYLSDLVSDIGISYSKVPFWVWPEWTEKGLYMRLYAGHDCPETNWLLVNKKDELAKRYPGCEVKVEMRPSIHYTILIQVHKAPVSDFVESPTLAKFNYALEIRGQQMDLIHHIEEIFKDYVTESK